MGDRELIDAVATLWVENGGDVDGLSYCIEKIKQVVKEKSEEKELHENNR